MQVSLSRTPCAYMVEGSTTFSAFTLEVPPKMEWEPLVDVVVEARRVDRDEAWS